MRLAVVDYLGRELVPGAIPTPRLAEKGRGEAYYQPNLNGSRPPGVWYLHEPGYEAPNGKGYTRVRVTEVAE